MRRKQWWKLGVLSYVGLFLISPAVPVLLAQGTQPASAYAASKQEANPQVLVDLIINLQRQVDQLHSQLKEVRSEQEAERSRNEEILRELEAVKKQFGQATPGGPTVSTGPSGSGQLSAQGQEEKAEQESSLEDRFTRMEESQQLTDEKLRDLNQTKVESYSKYRLRLSGIVLLNLFSTRGAVDYRDVPQLAVPGGPLGTDGSFGGSLRQSQVGLEGFGPQIWGAKTSASVKFDFAGGFPGTPNGETQGIARLRTGVVRFDWENTSLIAGQDALFLSPLSPTSLASLAVPALSYSGNLWNWAPQVRIERKIPLTDKSQLLLQGALMDNLTGDVPSPENASGANTSPSFGEKSGQPAYAIRISWTHLLGGQPMTLGAGGYYSRQDWGFGRTVDGWAGTLDLTQPLGRMVEFDGEFYRGKAVGGLAGGIGQTALWRTSLLDPATEVYGLDSMGGWAQLKFKLRPTVELNGSFGQDNPFANELRTLGGNVGFYNAVISRNLTALANIIYHPRSNVVASIEYRYIRTFQLDALPNTAHHVNLSLGYIF
jgi:hypothetical protein